MAVQFIGDDVFIQLHPDALIIQLICFDYAVDVAGQGFAKQLFDVHSILLLERLARAIRGYKLECAIVI